MAKTWVYNLKSHRYQDRKSGQFLSTERVLELTENYISQQQDKLTELGNRLITGELNVSEWEDQFADTLKEVLVNSYVLGRGGMAQMTPRDLGITSGIMREQYLYLRNFANEIMRGRMSTGQFQARQNLYIEKAYSVYWQGRVEAFKAEGWLYERDILTPGESCISCVRIAGRGWVRIGTNPPIGVDRVCKNNCRCRKKFSKEMPTNSLLEQPDGWIGGMPVVNRVYDEPEQRQNLYTMRSPTPEQLAKINQYRREGTPPFTASQFVTVPMRASHNLMSHSNMAWAPASLADMALGMPTKPYIKDHDWENLDAAMGFVYDAELLQSMVAPAEFLQGEYADRNRQILAKDGFFQLILHVAIEATHPIVRDIELRKVNGVSTGTLTKGIYLCPSCDLEFPCGQHLPPTNGIMDLKRRGELTEEEAAAIAPYIVRDGNFWSCEISQVNVPNLPGTNILG
ncbi:MAG: hypothetical protein ACRC62_10785 [Microcoleus sp.]